MQLSRRLTLTCSQMSGPVVCIHIIWQPLIQQPKWEAEAVKLVTLRFTDLHSLKHLKKHFKVFFWLSLLFSVWWCISFSFQSGWRKCQCLSTAICKITNTSGHKILSQHAKMCTYPMHSHIQMCGTFHTLLGWICATDITFLVHILSLLGWLSLFTYFPCWGEFVPQILLSLFTYFPCSLKDKYLNPIQTLKLTSCKEGVSTALHWADLQFLNKLPICCHLFSCHWVVLASLLSGDSPLFCTQLLWFNVSNPIIYSWFNVSKPILYSWFNVSNPIL